MQSTYRYLIWRYKFIRANVTEVSHVTENILFTNSTCNIRKCTSYICVLQKIYLRIYRKCLTRQKVPVQSLVSASGFDTSRNKAAASESSSESCLLGVLTIKIVNIVKLSIFQVFEGVYNNSRMLHFLTAVVVSFQGTKNSSVDAWVTSGGWSLPILSFDSRNLTEHASWELDC